MTHKNNINLTKGNPENSFNIAKNQEFELTVSCYFKNLISLKSTWNSQWSLVFSRNLKQWHHCPCPFRGFFKKGFLRKCSKPGHGNLVLITSTIQFELSKLNFNFDDIGKNLFSSRYCRQIIFVTLNGFFPLSKSVPPSLFLTDNIKMDRILIKIFLHCVPSFEGTFDKNL